MSTLEDRPPHLPTPPETDFPKHPAVPERPSDPGRPNIFETTELFSAPELATTKTRPGASHRGEIVFAFAVAIALAIAYKLLDVIILVYVSALFAVILTPVIRGLMRIRIGRWSPGKGAAIGILILAVAGSITAFIAFALPPVIHDVRQFIMDLPTRGPELLGKLKKLPFASHLDVTALNARLQSDLSNIASYIFTSATTWADKAFKIATGIILTVYFMLEGENAYAWMLSFFPARHRARLNKALLQADERMGKWLLGQGLLMLILGVSSTIVFALLHIRYAYALGVLMGAFNLIPVIGALISMSLVLLAAAMDSWGRVLGAVIFYAIYINIENSYLTPRIMQSRVNLAGLAVIVSLLVGAELAGILGAMVSVPTAVLVAVLLDEYAVQHDVAPVKIAGAKTIGS